MELPSFRLLDAVLDKRWRCYPSRARVVHAGESTRLAPAFAQKGSNRPFVLPILGQALVSQLLVNLGALRVDCIRLIEGKSGREKGSCLPSVN